MDKSCMNFNKYCRNFDKALIWDNFTTFCKEKMQTFDQHTSNQTIGNILIEWCQNIKIPERTRSYKSILKFWWNVAAINLQVIYLEHFKRKIVFQHYEKVKHDIYYYRETNGQHDPIKYSFKGSKMYSREMCEKMSGCWDEDSPIGLQAKFFFSASVCLNWSNIEACLCCVSHFQEDTNADGSPTGRIKYTFKSFDEDVYKDSSDEDSKYLIENTVNPDLCPVRLFKKLLSKRPGGIRTDRLFLRDNETNLGRKFSVGDWYKDSPICAYDISRWKASSAYKTRYGNIKTDIIEKLNTIGMCPENFISANEERDESINFSQNKIIIQNKPETVTSQTLSLIVQGDEPLTKRIRLEREDAANAFLSLKKLNFNKIKQELEEGNDSMYKLEKVDLDNLPPNMFIKTKPLEHNSLFQTKREEEFQRKIKLENQEVYEMEEIDFEHLTEEIFIKEENDKLPLLTLLEIDENDSRIKQESEREEKNELEQIVKESVVDDPRIFSKEKVDQLPLSALLEIKDNEPQILKESVTEDPGKKEEYAIDLVKIRSELRSERGLLNIPKLVRKRPIKEKITQDFSDIPKLVPIGRLNQTNKLHRKIFVTRLN